MQAIEFETTVDPQGNLHLPEKYRDVAQEPCPQLLKWGNSTFTDVTPWKISSRDNLIEER